MGIGSEGRQHLRLAPRGRDSGRRGTRNLRRRGRIALGLVVLAIGAGVAWWALRSAPRPVFFAELRFDQAFEPLSSDAAPSKVGLENGYRFLLESRQLHPATGRVLGKGGMALGLAWYRPEAHPPRELAQTLILTQGSEFAWPGPGPELRRRSDRFAGLAEPQPLEFRQEENRCSITVDGEQLSVAVGESARTKPRIRMLTIDAAITALRAATPALPNPDEATRAWLGLRLDPDGDGQVRIHESYSLACHGRVELHPDDLVLRFSRARSALARGDKAEARLEITALAVVDPRDPAVRALESQLDNAADEERVGLTVSAPLPAAAATDAIVEVTVWPADAGPEAAVAQFPVTDGNSQVFLPAGEYELECYVMGHAPVRVHARIPQQREVRCALR